MCYILFMKNNLLKTLFIETFLLSAFTFGGGYVIISLFQKTFVEKYKWIDQDEMLDLIAIAQSCPGAIAINGAIVLGYKLAKLPGIFIALLGTILPPFFIISLISIIYNFLKSNIFFHLFLNGMLIGVGAIIFSIVYEMIKPYIENKQYLNLIFILLVVILTIFFKVNASLLILITLIYAFIFYYWRKR